MLLLFPQQSYILSSNFKTGAEAAGQRRLPSILHMVVHIFVHSVLPPNLGVMFWILLFSNQVSSAKPLQKKIKLCTPFYFFKKENTPELTKILFPVSYKVSFNYCAAELMLAIKSQSLGTFQILFSLSLSSVLIIK